MRVSLLSVGAAAPAQLERVLAAAAHLGGPVTFAPVACELVPSLRAQPALASALGTALSSGQLVPLLALANGSDASLLDAAELADELRLAGELLQSLGARPSERRGFVGEGDASALEEAGLDFVLTTALGQAARVGERLLALPLVAKDAIVVRVDGDDADAFESAVARVAALKHGGAQLVAVDAVDARGVALTAPWLPRATLPAVTRPRAVRALVELCRWLAESFALATAPHVPVAALVEEGWRLERLPARARVPLLLRRVTAADRRALIAAFELCDVISVEARVPGRPPRVTRALDEDALACVRAWGAATGAGEPLARAATAYEELRQFRFLGSARWRTLASALRDACALASMQGDPDWSLADRATDESDELRDEDVIVALQDVDTRMFN